MGRWVRSGTALAVVVVLVAALSVIVTIQPAGLGRADVCTDVGGRQFEAVGGCTEPGAAAPFALPPPEDVPPPAEAPFAPPPPPESVALPRESVVLPPQSENRLHPAITSTWDTVDPSNLQQSLPSGSLGGVDFEVGTYMSSENLRIYGLICYPAAGSGFPVLIINHGGLGPAGSQSLNNNSFNACVQMASAGWLVATSTYRGNAIAGLPFPGFENWPGRTSDGQPEFCGGEADDSRYLLAAVENSFPQANANHVLMWGHSHGSCITELAIERGAAPQIAVSIDGPTDFTVHTNFVGGVAVYDGTQTWAQLKTTVARCDTCEPANASLPGPVADQYQLWGRSSANSVNNLTTPSGRLANNPNLDFLRIHGEGDGLVPPQFGCELAAALGPGSNNYWFHTPDDFGNTDMATNKLPGTFDNTRSNPGGTPPECAPWRITWKFGQPTPDLWNPPHVWDHHAFIFYSCPIAPANRQNPPVPETGCPFGQPRVEEHADIIVQSWPEVASFVKQFAAGWGAPWPAQFVAFE